MPHCVKVYFSFHFYKILSHKLHGHVLCSMDALLPFDVTFNWEQIRLTSWISKCISNVTFSKVWHNFMAWIEYLHNISDATSSYILNICFQYESARCLKGVTINKTWGWFWRYKISDGSPRSRVCASLTLRSAKMKPVRHKDIEIAHSQWMLWQRDGLAGRRRRNRQMSRQAGGQR